MDIISDLPDSILSQILSFLPTKFAVGTCILSRRWQRIFPFGHPPIYLNLDDSLRLNPLQNENSISNPTSFLDFVNKLLYTTLRDVSCVERVDLDCKRKYDETDVVSWVSALLRLNVRYLMLRVPMNDTDVLCKRLRGCTTLVGLTLAMKCELFIPYDFSLPSLKRLCLRDLEFDDTYGGSVNELIKGCPLIERLCLTGCEVSCVRKLSIKCPFLKHLVLEMNWFSSGENITVLELDAPGLEHLTYSDNVACGYSISTFNSLLSAYINVGATAEHGLEGYYDDYFEYYNDEVDDDPWKFYTDISKVVVACSSTKHLYLTECSIIALHHSSLELSQFQNLTRLELGNVRLEGWMVMACLLKKAPNLKHLGFEQAFSKIEKGFADFEQLVPSLPVCLEQHLKTVVFRMFDVKGDEIKLLCYFLQNGEVLEKVQFNSVEILIRKQIDGVVVMDSSCGSTSCGIALPSSSSPSYESRVVEIIMQMEARRAEQEHAKRVREQLYQFQLLSEWQYKQWTMMERMMSEASNSNTPLATLNRTMNVLLESKEKLAMINLSDLSVSRMDVLQKKERMVLINQKMIQMMSALIQRQNLPGQPPSTPPS